MSDPVALDEAQRVLTAATESVESPLPAPEGVNNIGLTDLGYPDCIGYQVPEPKLVYDLTEKRILIHFEESDQGIAIPLAPEIAQFVLRDGIGYSFRWIIAAYLVMNGVHYRHAAQWLPKWLNFSVESFAKLNNLDLPFRFSSYNDEESSGGDLSDRIKAYSDRTDKSVKADVYLKHWYGKEIEDGTLTLSDLKQRDLSLWRGLRNWAHAGGYDLDTIIPRGENLGGRPREFLGFDPSALNASDPIHAAALKLARKRESDRQSAAIIYRSRRKSLTP